MAELNIAEEHEYTFDTDRKGTAVRVKFTAKSNDVIRRVVTVESAKTLIKGAFDYIDQFDIGSSMISTLAAKDWFYIWFCNCGSDAMSPPGGPESYTNRTPNPAIKWCPVAVTWFFDCGQSTAKRNSTLFPSDFNGDLVVRRSDDTLVYDNSNPPHVMGIQSCAAVLFHEMGHLLQYYMKPQYFTSHFIAAWRENHDHLVEVNGQIHEVPDIDAPWEVDNVNWNEQPFVKQARAAGICEGYKAHYSDAIGGHYVDEVAFTESCGMLVPKVKIGTDWFHTNVAWKLKSATSVSELHIDAMKTAQKNIIKGLGKVKPLKPSADYIKRTHEKFIG